MNIIVTGATSFLGAAVVKELLRTGNHVYAVIRPSSSNRDALKAAAGEDDGGMLSVIESELKDLRRLDMKISERCPVYIHFAWGGSGSDDRKNACLQQQNALYAYGAFEGAAALGCKRFIFGGSQAEYGHCKGLMSEDVPCDPVSCYGRAKYQVYRDITEKLKEQNDIDYIHARIFSVYGPGDHPWTLVSSCIRTLVNGGKMELSDCDQLWNFLYIDDLARAVSALALSEERLGYDAAGSENGIYNIAGDEDATMPLRDYVEQIYELCGCKGELIFGALPYNAEGFNELIPDIGKIRSKTGWGPGTGFKDGILKMLEEINGQRNGDV